MPLCDLATFSAHSNKTIRSSKHVNVMSAMPDVPEGEPLDERIFPSVLLVTFNRSAGQTVNADSGGQL